MYSVYTHSPNPTQVVPHLPRPPSAAVGTGGAPIVSGTYRTTLIRRERFKFGSCKSAPVPTKSADNQEVKSHSSTDLNQIVNMSKEDSVLEYIKHSREIIGLETVPSQFPSVTNTAEDSRGPITGVRDLRVLSCRRRLSGKSSQTKKSLESVEFVYALPKENTKGCSVYELYITTAEKARAQTKFYTISAFNVSEVGLSALDGHCALFAAPCTHRWMECVEWSLSQHWGGFGRKRFSTNSPHSPISSSSCRLVFSIVMMCREYVFASTESADHLKLGSCWSVIGKPQLLSEL